MATIPDSRQNVIIDGNLEIKTKPSDDGSTLGRIVFTDETAGDLGALKIFGGGPGYYRLVLDTSKVYRGISFRTTASQGSSQEGGQNIGYTMDVQSNYIALNNYTTIAPLEARYPTGDFSGTLLRISKTKDSTISKYSNMLDLQMQTFLAGQAVLMEISQSGSYGVGMGYKNPVGGYASTDSYGFLSHRISSSPYQSEVLKFYRNGNVNIPVRLDVGTISATTYLNLPATDVLPITLDKTNLRVGINNPNPSKDLDVTGDTNISGHLTVGTSITGQLTQGVQPGITGVGVLAGLDVSGSADFSSGVSVGQDLSVTGAIFSSEAHVLGTITVDRVTANHYDNLPIQSIAPITLDGTKVGINKTVPNEALDVQGNILATGSITGTWIQGDDILATNITTSTINAGTYLNLPPTNVLPITLDNTNNRVGINQPTPTSALDVVGSITASTSIFPSGTTASVIQSGTGTPEGSKVGNPGSLYLRTDGTPATSLYVKGSGTGNVGWTTVGGSTTVSYYSNFLTANVNVVRTQDVQNILSLNIPSNGVYMVTAYIDLRSTVTVANEIDTTYGVYTTSNGAGNTTDPGFNKATSFNNRRLTSTFTSSVPHTFSFIAVNTLGARTLYLNKTLREAGTWTDGHLVFGIGTGIVACLLGSV